MVKSVAELPRRINEAFEIATTGRPGPVLVDLPKDIQAAILRKPIPTASMIPSNSSPAGLIAKDSSHKQLEGAIHRVARLINIAKKPIIYAGQGVLAHPGPNVLKELADKACIPVTTTVQGLGSFDELDEKSLHMLGMHGAPYANLAIQEADLVIALGARFDDRVTGRINSVVRFLTLTYVGNITKFAPNAKAAAAKGLGGIVHFEVQRKNINKVVQATEAVQGDVATNLALLLPSVNKKLSRPEWFSQISDWKKRLPFLYERETPEGLIKPQAVIEALSNLTRDIKDRTIITTGVGQHQMFAAQFFRWRYPRTMITSGGLGTMGFGLPAAIGVKVAQPDALVIDIDGDASFCMSLSELSTAAQFNIAVKVLILNNEGIYRLQLLPFLDLLSRMAIGKIPMIFFSLLFHVMVPAVKSNANSRECLEQGMVTQWQSLFYEDRFAHTHQKVRRMLEFTTIPLETEPIKRLTPLRRIESGFRQARGSNGRAGTKMP